MRNELQFAKGLEELINRYSMENGSNTPDFILAGFLVGCLRAFDVATLERDRWHRGGIVLRGSGEYTDDLDEAASREDSGSK